MSKFHLKVIDIKIVENDFSFISNTESNTSEENIKMIEERFKYESDKTLMNKLIKEMKEQYAVYEKVPAHGGEINGVILGPFKTKEEAEQVRQKYGYTSDNYYVDILTDE
jgi:L-fucose isomerase-like protein